MRQGNTAPTRRSTTAGSVGAIGGVFARILAGLAAEHGEETTVMINATHLKAHPTASSLGFKKGGVDA